MAERESAMESMSVSLPSEMARFVDERLRGKFGNRSEYVRHLIRADAERAAKERLESLLIEGLESGEPREITPGFWDEIRDKARKEAERRKRRQRKSA